MSEPSRPPASAAAPSEREPAPVGAPAPSPPLGRAARWAMPVLALCALAALFWPRGEKPYAAPAGFLVDGSGRPAPLAREFAPVTLVHFWATWCPPCMTEIPALKRLITDFESQPQFRVVLIAVADRPPAVETFLGSLAGRALYDPQWEVAHRYGTEQVPETYIVVAGKVVDRLIGAVDWDDARMRDRLRALLAAQQRG